MGFAAEVEAKRKPQPQGTFSGCSCGGTCAKCRGKTEHKETPPAAGKGHSFGDVAVVSEEGG